MRLSASIRKAPRAATFSPGKSPSRTGNRPPVRGPSTTSRPSNTPGAASTYTTFRVPVSITASSGTLSTWSSGTGASRARYRAGSALSFGGHAAQHVQTFRPSTSTAIGSPIEPSFAPVTGQVACWSGVTASGGFVAIAAGAIIAASFARNGAGSARSFGGQASQHVQITRPATSTAIGGPIVPSSASVTGQIFCSSTVRFPVRRTRPRGRRPANRAWNSGVSAIAVFRVTVANMPGRSRSPGFSSAYRTSTVRVDGSTFGWMNSTLPENVLPGNASTLASTACPR